MNAGANASSTIAGLRTKAGGQGLKSCTKSKSKDKTIPPGFIYASIEVKILLLTFRLHHDSASGNKTRFHKRNERQHIGHRLTRPLVFPAARRVKAKLVVVMEWFRWSHAALLNSVPASDEGKTTSGTLFNGPASFKVSFLVNNRSHRFPAS